MAQRETAVLNARHLTSLASELNTMKKKVDNNSNTLGWAATIAGFFGVPGAIVSITALAEVVGLQVASSMIQDVIDVVQDAQSMLANGQCDLVEIEIKFNYYDSGLRGSKPGYFPSGARITRVHVGHGWQIA